jgi:nicotinamide-nucleotide amidase
MAADPTIGLVRRLQEACLARGLTVATAESCTGGLVAAALTANPGSSGYVRGGVVAYADEIKIAALDVPASTLAEHGAVSEETALAMAEGARRRLAVDVAVSVTGVAGPDGGTPTKPVGLTWIAVAGPSGTTAERRVWPGDREANRRDSVRLAIEVLLAEAERVPPAS